MCVIIDISSSLTSAMPSSIRSGWAMMVVERAYTAHLPSEEATPQRRRRHFLLSTRTPSPGNPPTGRTARGDRRTAPTRRYSPFRTPEIANTDEATSDSMPAGLRWFAENQPFTAFIETLRGLLTGAPIGNSGLLTVTWCVVIALGGYLWARALYTRNSTR